MAHMDLAVIIIVVWVMSTCCHEFGHAITAYIGGDKSVKDKGYLTLNPIVYFNSATTLIIPVLVLMIGGIPLPGAAVYINQGRIKSRFMQSLVSLAGPMFTLLFMILLVVALNILPEMRGTIGSAHLYRVLTTALSTLIYLHIFVFILNLLPIPPLDGFGIIEPWLPAAARKKLREYSNLGFFLLIALFWFCDPFSFALSFVSALAAAALGVDYDNARAGIVALKESSYPLIGLIIVAWIIRGKLSPPAERADKLIKEGKFQEALPLYDQALAKKQDARVLAASATCLLNLGRKVEALPRAEKAVSLDPESPQVLGIYGACLTELGQFEPAVEALTTAIKYDTDSLYPFTQFVLASALNQKGRCDEALFAIDKYLASTPNSHEGLFTRGTILENLNRFDEALSVYNKAARSSPAGNIRAALGKGMLLCALDKTREGLDEFNKFLPADTGARAAEIANLKRLLCESAARLDARGQSGMAEAARKAAMELS